ncbi:TonB-dependent receptor domain-containing protein [Ferruginibacter sp.]
MQKYLLVILLVIVSTGLYAQDKGAKSGGISINGRIIDSLSQKPVEYVTISLYKNGDVKPVNGTVTNTAGHFSVTATDSGSYKIVAEFIGYRSYTINNIAVGKKAAAINLPDILLFKNPVTMQAVTVTSSAGLIENKIDKMVFNAEKDLTSQGGAATDILKKVPQVNVDVDGNVELAGTSSIRFLINGKPSTAFGSNVTDVLQSIPASQVKSIEVITNPGAKYDAQGLGGIINIILKQSKVKGINGNISLTAGSLNENGSLNFNARKGELGFNAFVSGNARLTTSIYNTSQRSSADTAAKKNLSLLQDGSSRYKRHGSESGAGFDWTYKKNNNFTGSFRYGSSYSGGIGSSSQLQTINDAVNGALLSSIAAANNTSSSNKSYNTDVNLSYRRTFAKEDQELEISVNSSYEHNKTLAENYQRQLPLDSLVYGINSANPGEQKEKELQVDYTQPLTGDMILGVGGKINRTEVISDAGIYSYKTLDKKYFYDTALSNNLDYKQDVYALYGELSFPLGKILDVKLGSRYERTEINSYYSNAQKQVGKHGYNTVVPSIFFSRKINDNETIKLSYSKRIERPDYGDLNPFINTTDPKNVSAGNPYLKPEVGHRFELGYTHNFEKAGSFMVTAFYRRNEQDIQPFIVFYPSIKIGDSVYNNVAVSTRQNIGTENNMGMNFFVDLRPTSKLTVRSNLFAFKRHTINAIDPGYNSNSFNYRFNINTAYQFSNTLAGEFFGNFSSARNEAQGKYPSLITYSIALRKQFWNKKGSLAFGATNPLSKYVDQRTILFGPNFTTNSTRSIPFRSFTLNFSWKFGKLEFKKKKEENKDAGASDNL